MTINYNLFATVFIVNSPDNTLKRSETDYKLQSTADFAQKDIKQRVLTRACFNNVPYFRHDVQIKALI